MSRLVIPTLILLFLTVPVSAVHYVREPGPLYEVKYSVLSNGTEALVHLSVLQWGLDCGMTSCWPAVFGGHQFLLHFNGSQLYLLNFTSLFKAPYVDYKGATFTNGSWYLEVSYYSPDCSTQVDKIYRLDTRDFCIEPANVSWFYVPKGEAKDEINGWKIELQSPGPGEWSYTNVSDMFIALNQNASKWSPVPPTIPDSGLFPVYFTLKKDNVARNITLIYVNTTDNPLGLVQGLWFPDDVKIVNITVCEKTSANTSTDTPAEANLTSPTTETRPNKTETTTNTGNTETSICGPGLIGLLALVPLISRRR